MCPHRDTIVVTYSEHAMEKVGIRDLKARLSRHLRRVRSGVTLVVTERGRAIASIQPIETAEDVAWAHAFVSAGLGQWSGGKPDGASAPAQTKRGKAVSDAVLEDRR